MSYTESEYFVIDADEYYTAFFDKRSKFVHYHPETLIINNIEYDHADIFHDLAAIRDEFHNLVRTLPETAKIIYPLGDNEVETVLNIGCWTPLATFIWSGSDWSITDASRDYRDFSIINSGNEVGKVSWPVIGEHNAFNALAAIIAAKNIGVSVEKACAALSEFKSVKRRLECIYDSNDIYIYDDFAHHPTAIKTTLKGLKGKYKSSRIIALIEMRSNTMKSGLHDDLLNLATEEADVVYWKSDNKSQLELLQAQAPAKTKAIYTIDETVEEVVSSLKPNDLIVTMSNGSFDGLSDSLFKALSNA